MSSIALIVGTVLGTSLDVAEQLEDRLTAQCYTVTLYNAPSAWPRADVILLCVSTTGRGNIPGGLLPLIQRIEAGDIDVSGQRYGIIALGDSRYPTFCGAGRAIDEMLARRGAERVGERLELDAAETDRPDDDALAWLPQWLCDAMIAPQ